MNNDIVSGMFVVIAIVLAIAANFARSDPPQAALTLGTAGGLCDAFDQFEERL